MTSQNNRHVGEDGGELPPPPSTPTPRHIQRTATQRTSPGMATKIAGHTGTLTTLARMALVQAPPAPEASGRPNLATSCTSADV